MRKNIIRTDKVSVCYKDSCIHSYGRNASMIAKGFAILLLVLATAAFIRAVR